MSESNGGAQRISRIAFDLEQARAAGDIEREANLRRLLSRELADTDAKDWCVEETDLAAVQPRPVRWFWHDRIPLGMVTILCGAKGSGKGQIACRITAAVTTGGTLPADGGREIRVPEGRVVYLNAEDPREESLVPRLVAAGADLANVVHLARVVSPDGTPFPLTLAHHWAQVKAKVEAVRPLLFAVDTAVTHMGCEFTIEEAGPVMARLSMLSEDVGCATLLVCHPVKVPHARASSDIPGGLSYGPRSVLLAGTTEGKHRRALFHLDSNVGPEAEPLGYQVVPVTAGGVETSRVEFTGRTDLTLDEIRHHRPPREEPAPARAEAFLRAVLGGGPRKTADIDRQACRPKDKGGQGLSSYALKEARRAINGLLDVRIGSEGWLALPEHGEQLMTMKEEYDNAPRRGRR